MVARARTSANSSPVGRSTRALVAVALLALVGCAPALGGTLGLEVHTGPGSELIFVPDEIVAPAGARVALTVTNTSSQPHNLVLVDPIGVATRSILAAGQSDTVVFAAPPPGSYRFVCSIHPGMEGLFEVR